MSLMQMRHLGSRTRAKAMFFLQTVAYNRKRLLVKSGLLSSVVQQLLMVMAVRFHTIISIKKCHIFIPSLLFFF